MVMKLNSVLLVGLVSIGLLTFGADIAPGGYLSAGNSGGLRAASSYRLAPTPANQACEKQCLDQIHSTNRNLWFGAST